MDDGLMDEWVIYLWIHIDKDIERYGKYSPLRHVLGTLENTLIWKVQPSKASSWHSKE